MNKAAACHKTYFGELPEIISEVPGVCTLMGAFSDFCDGWCITSTGALGLRVAVSERQDNLVKLYDATHSEKKHFALTSLKFRKEDRLANYIKGLFAVLHHNCSITFSQGFNITIKGALLYCDELTVSVAMASGVLLSLDRLKNLGLSAASMIKLCYQACAFYPGMNCRYRDIMTLFNAEPGKLLFFDLGPMRFEKTDYPFGSPEEGAYGIILDPKVPPQLLRGEIEEKRKEAEIYCKRLSAITGETELRSLHVRDLRAQRISGMTEHQKRACEYVISESNDVLKGFQAIKNKDAKTFGKILKDIYFSMRDDFEISCPEIDWLVKRARETDGVYGASLISNGDTGSIFMMLEREGEIAYKSHMEEYQHIFDFVPATRVFKPGGPARVLDTIE